MSNEFQQFSQELAQWRESEDYVEHDLSRLNEMIGQFQEDFKRLDQSMNTPNWSRPYIDVRSMKICAHIVH